MTHVDWIRSGFFLVGSGGFGFGARPVFSVRVGFFTVKTRPEPSREEQRRCSSRDFTITLTLTLILTLIIILTLNL
ncbi:hypothetical protein C2G38_1041787 [Gigaspora rosea]|uniref:Uncharacterized protein n=1 Tax=Gigaspora rosea TaxID=44941 RepID=A0A397W6H5_9GLOM|nr:hypothetical protein C2G38_1041787 [Gigaspora rosea]